MTKAKETIEDYLRKPYTRYLIPESETGTFAAGILEFPGCLSQGDTPQEAYENLEEAARDWIEVSLEEGQHIPEPLGPLAHSGRIALRVSRALHKQSAAMAHVEGVSLNQWISAAMAEKAGAMSLYARLTEKLAQSIRMAGQTIQVIVQTPILGTPRTASSADQAPGRMVI